VQVINKQTTKSKRLMQLIRFFVLKCMKLNTIFRAVLSNSKCNAIADAISRQQWERFWQMAPNADREPFDPPHQFLRMIFNLRIDDC
jgi:hypothetical protein